MCCAVRRRETLRQLCQLCKLRGAQVRTQEAHCRSGRLSRSGAGVALQLTVPFPGRLEPWYKAGRKCGTNWPDLGILCALLALGFALTI